MTATVTGDAQEQVLGVVRKSQEMTLEAIKQVVETVNAAAERLPAVPFAGKLPFLSRLPGVPALPAPEAAVSATFDFLDALLAEQRRFAQQLIRTTAALRPAVKSEPAGEEPVPAAG